MKPHPEVMKNLQPFQRKLYSWLVDVLNERKKGGKEDVKKVGDKKVL